MRPLKVWSFTSSLFIFQFQLLYEVRFWAQCLVDCLQAATAVWPFKINNGALRGGELLFCGLPRIKAHEMCALWHRINGRAGGGVVGVKQQNVNIIWLNGSMCLPPFDVFHIIASRPLISNTKHAIKRRNNEFGAQPAAWCCMAKMGSSAITSNSCVSLLFLLISFSVIPLGTRHASRREDSEAWPTDTPGKRVLSKRRSLNQRLLSRIPKAETQKQCETKAFFFFFFLCAAAATSVLLWQRKKWAKIFVYKKRSRVYIKYGIAGYEWRNDK